MVKTMVLKNHGVILVLTNYTPSGDTLKKMKKRHLGTPINRFILYSVLYINT
jgi:hypothetical protein